MLPKHRQKTFSVWKFSSKHVWCQKKHLRCPIFRRPRTTFLKHYLKANVFIFLYISLRNFLFQWRSKILSGGTWRKAEKRLAVWVSWDLLYFFILIEIFRNSNIFLYFDTFINSIGTLKFSKQLGNIMAKFLMKKYFLSI